MIAVSLGFSQTAPAEKEPPLMLTQFPLTPRRLENDSEEQLGVNYSFHRGLISAQKKTCRNDSSLKDALAIYQCFLMLFGRQGYIQVTQLRVIKNGYGSQKKGSNRVP